MFKKKKLKFFKKKLFLSTVRTVSGVLRVARGGSGAKAPPLAVRPVPWNGRGRRLANPTEVCYSEADSQGLPLWIQESLRPWDTHYQFSINTLLSKTNLQLHPSTLGWGEGIYVRVHIHVHMRVHKHVYLRVHAHIRVHARTHYTRIHTHYAHTNTRRRRRWTLPLLHVRTHMEAHTCLRVCLHTFLYVYRGICI